MKARPSKAKREPSICLLITVFVWSVWLILLGPISAINVLQAYWPVTLTMLFGSVVAGGTSMGGGAVAFPVLTKLLDVPPHEAKGLCPRYSKCGHHRRHIYHHRHENRDGLETYPMGQQQWPDRHRCWDAVAGTPAVR